MATIDTETFQSSANLSLWLKVYTGDVLNLADVPEIIPLRWVYFRDNWTLISRRVLNIANNTTDPDYLRAVIDDLTDFINKQRNDSTDVNPFASNKIYYRFYPVFDNLTLESISLTNEERTLIANKKTSVSDYSKNDFLKIKKTLRAYRDNIADLVGLSDPDYNSVYERSPVLAQSAATITDLNLMKVIQGQLQVVDFILANLFAVDTSLDPFALAKANANNPDINIGQYQSGKLVKLNAGEDLPSLSKRVFGDPDQWMNIAIANGLKDPYIDEIGEEIFLIANGSGNQINIAAQDPRGNENIVKFSINQSILIQSNTIPFPSQRTLLGVKQIPLSGEIILTLSGDANMNQYVLSDRASIRIFKPNTINSSQYILIPSDSPLTNSRSDEIPWFLSGAGADEKATKIDISVDDNGSLLMTSTGDIALSYGLENAVQAVKAKLLTELGSNRRHPDYGLVNTVGVATAKAADAQAAIVESISTQIQADKRFDRIVSLDVQRNTSTNAVVYDVTLVVKIAGSNTFLPITFTVAT